VNILNFVVIYEIGNKAGEFLAANAEYMRFNLDSEAMANNKVKNKKK